MAIIPTTEGRIPFNIPAVSEECWTFYKVIGDLAASEKPPLIMIHGGPGAGHEYLVPFGKLWSERKIPIILYDQIGCASSTHLRDTKGDESLWKESLFIDEFFNLVSFFKLERYSILGHSWGGGLGASLATKKPSGLQRLILFSAAVDMAAACEYRNALIYKLPAEHRDAFLQHEENPGSNKAEFGAAVEYFFRKYAYRDEPFPGEDFGHAFANLTDDDTVSETMGGPGFMTCTGSLKDFTVVPRLADIEVPVLLVEGEFDYVSAAGFVSGIKKAKCVTLMGASHMCFLEAAGKEKALALVGSFLDD